MAEACKRLIKNCIICWNYLYLSQRLEEVAHGSTVAWRHLNQLGEYDFPAEKLRDSVGTRLPSAK
jgi:Tn3 transposase DDE domain